MIIGISGRAGAGKDYAANLLAYMIHKRMIRTEFQDSEIDFNIYRKFKLPLESGWEVRRFADKLKDMVCLLLNCTREMLEDRVFKEKELREEWWYYKPKKGELIPYDRDENHSNMELVKPTPRMLMQLVGTDCGRKIIHPNVWINSTLTSYKLENNWIIPDVRFINEAEAIQKKRGLVIRIERLGLERNEDVHESEKELDDWGGFFATVENDNTFEGFLENIKDLNLI